MVDEINIKIEKFKDWMLRELEKNDHKGSILNFKDFNGIVTELEYHKAKMLIVIRCNNKQAVKEYIADVANFLFCLGNSGGIYDDDFLDISSEESIEIRKDKNVFQNVTEQQINQQINFK